MRRSGIFSFRPKKSGDCCVINIEDIIQPGVRCMREEEPSKAAWIQSVLAEHEKPLVRYALHLTGNLDTARDVVQETFLRLCSQDPKKVRESVAPWLFAVCRSRALDIMRKEKRLNAASLEDEREQDSSVTDDSWRVERFEESEAISRILRVLGKLSANQQEVIRLRFEEGFSYQEISRVTGLSVTNVGFLLHAGLKAIRLQIKPSEEERVLRRIK